MSDAEAATWGEFFMCKPAPKRFVHLRIGTGVALGVIIDGCFEDIEPGRTTHAKLLIVDDSASAALCRCGLSGCLETIASGTILAARTGELGLGESVEALDRTAREGHSEAVAIIERVAAAISRAIERVVLHYEPETICLGGGLVERMPFLAQAIRRATGRDADTSDQWPSGCCFTIENWFRRNPIFNPMGPSRTNAPSRPGSPRLMAGRAGRNRHR